MLFILLIHYYFISIFQYIFFLPVYWDENLIKISDCEFISEFLKVE